VEKIQMQRLNKFGRAIGMSLSVQYDLKVSFNTCFNCKFGIVDTFFIV